MKIKVLLEPAEPAEVALRKILRNLLGELRGNIEGILDDRDSEFVHDLRVAVRRTRSALAQIKDVLPRKEVVGFRSEFKWLGAITGDLRDLDVFLIELAASMEEQPKHLEHVERLLPIVETARKEARDTVCEALNSARFAALLSDWSAFLDRATPVGSRPANADFPIFELASKRILKAYGRVLRRGGNLGEEPTPEEMHRLRIDAKKLRYLLEFFCSLYPVAEVERLVGELKKVQNILGGINDAAVQQRKLAFFAGDLAAQGPEHSDARRAANRLAEVLAKRQREFIDALAGRIAVFADEDNQARYRSLFSAGSTQ